MLLSCVEQDLSGAWLFLIDLAESGKLSVLHLGRPVYASVH